MIISFDIDNTLIPYTDEFEVEDKKIMSKILRAESIRKGTIDLFNRLENKGHTIWIYTTSLRTVFNLRKTFRSYGLNPAKFINGNVNQKQLKIHNCNASKNPNLFGIDVHVDDLEGVKIEGDQYGFKTIIIKPDEKDWAKTVLKAVDAINMNLDWQFDQLLITLISLKSNAKRQVEICGYGDTAGEMASDFDTYYSRIRTNLIEYGYLTKPEDEKLSKLNDFLKTKFNDSSQDFWNGLDIHEDWEKIRKLAKEVLIEMKKENISLEVKHISEKDKNQNISIIRTETTLIDK